MVTPPRLFLLPLIASFLSLSSSRTQPPAPSSLIFPVVKDEASRQYYTTIALGTPPSPVKAVLDLSGSYSWFDCAAHYNPSSSSSHRHILCSSARCRAARGGGCFNDTCSVFVHNPLTDVVIGAGLGEDVAVVHHTDGIKYTSQGVIQLPFSCVPSEFMRGISGAGNGVIALSLAPTSLATKSSADLNLPHKLALCLPSSSSSSSGHGDFYLGGGPYLRPPIKQDISKSLLVTQLLIDPVSQPPSHGSASPSDQYFIDVTAIKVNFAPVNFTASLLAIDKNGRGGTKISTLTPYTVLHSTIYRALVAEFSRQAAEKKIRRVEPIAPFGACFDTRSVRSGVAGPDVPVIVLVLRSDAQWRIEGANSMVRVSKEVMCLGFVEGGSRPRTAIVIGAHQMEDNLVEFDVASLMFRFSNSLLLRNTSCSHS